jgi:ribonucleoside-diphosphate reductase alpha chain
MGPRRVTSLPDAVAGALVDQYFTQENVQQLNLPIDTSDLFSTPVIENGNGNGHDHEYGVISGADMCPSCATVSLVRAEGCRKCLTCGYSEC